MAPKGVPATKRKLKRNNSTSEAVEVCTILAVRGGLIKEPMPLPTVQHSGQDFVKVVSTTAWLVALLSGTRSNRTITAAICSALAAVKDEFRQNAPMPNVAVPEIAAEISQRRAASGLSDEEKDDGDDDDDDASDGANSDDHDSKPARPPSTQPKVRFSAREVSVRGVEMIATFDKDNLHLPANTASIAAFVRLVETFSEKDVQDRQAAKKQALAAAYASGGEKNKDLVKFLHSRRTWCASYTDKDGQQHQFIKGLTPAFKDEFGNVLSSHEYAQEYEKKRLEAVKAWNKLDKSDRPRLVEA